MIFQRPSDNWIIIYDNNNNIILDIGPEPENKKEQ